MRLSGKLLNRTNGGGTFRKRRIALGRSRPSPTTNQAAASSDSSSSPAACKRSTVSWHFKQ